MSRWWLAIHIRVVLLIALFASAVGPSIGTAQRELPTTDSTMPDFQGALPWGIPDDAERMIVDKVVDGDTLRLTYPGDDWYYPVRMIGIQAPETDGPYTRRECYGPEATEFLTKLLPVGTGVFVQRDVTDEDRNGRLLRHIFVAGPKVSESSSTVERDEDEANFYLLSEVLVLGGFAVTRSYPPDDLYDDVLAEAGAMARDERAGLWRACTA